MRRRIIIQREWGILVDDDDDDVRVAGENEMEGKEQGSEGYLLLTFPFPPFLHCSPYSKCSERKNNQTKQNKKEQRQ